LKNSILQYIDFKLFQYLLLVLLAGLAFSFFGSIGVLLIVITTLLFNAFLYKNNQLTLFFAFIFLDSFSLVWGGDWGFVNFPVDLVDKSLTNASNILGYILLILIVLTGKKLPRANAVDYWITLFFLLGIVSPLTATDPSEPLVQAFRFLQFYILYILIRVLIQSALDIEFYFKYIVASFIPLFTVIILQYGAGYFGEGYDLGSPGKLTSFIPYLLALTTISARKKWMAWIALFVSIFFSLFDGSRRYFIGILGYFGLHFKMKKEIFVLFIVLLYIASPFLYDIIPGNTRMRLENTYRDTKAVILGEADYQTVNRLGSKRWELWGYTWEIFKDHPIIGVGLKNQVKLIDEYGADYEARTHNFYLEVLTDLGVVGFIVLVMVIYHGFKALNRSISTSYWQSNFLKQMILAYKYDLIMLHVIAFLGGSMFYNKGGWVLYALVGSLSSISTRYNRISRHKNANHNTPILS
jgi:O-antigen ligase